MKSFSSGLFVLMVCLVSLTVSTQILAGDCVKNQDGNAVCGEGQCAVDQYGKVSVCQGGRRRDEGLNMETSSAAWGFARRTIWAR